MRLDKIRLQNFRQFYGDQSIQIAPPGNKNVTLVHAENGVGKTTLLNAVLWTLFEETTSKFEEKEQILNYVAEKEGIQTATVEVTFEHEGAIYLAKRDCTTARGNGRSRFSIVKINPNGTFSDALPNPSTFINSVIPREMARYFFFDGEQAETYASQTNSKAISEAIRNVLGSSLVIETIADLKYIERKFGEELTQLPGESEITQLEDSVLDIDKRIAQNELRVEELTNNISALEHQLAEIEQKLAEAQESATLEAGRRAIVGQLEGCESQICECRANIEKWVGSKATALVSLSLTSRALDFVDEESLRGRIPSPYNEEFVKGLLHAENCVCNRPLLPGTPEWVSVQNLLKDAANVEILERVVRARSRVIALTEQREDAPALLLSYQEKLATLLERRSMFEQQKVEIETKLANLPVAELQQREFARRQVSRDLENTKMDRVRIQRDIEHDTNEKTAINRKIADLALESVQARRLVIRKEVADRAGAMLVELQRTYEHDARQQIESAVNEILRLVARRHYRIEISETFDIRLLMEDGRPSPKSSGENQLMSLAFIAALVQLAESRSQLKDAGPYIPATVAPLVLDSPFGQLDDKYRLDTVGFVPKMSPQVVLLVSTSQGSQDVRTAIAGRVGKEYVLVAHNSGSQDGKADDLLEVGGELVKTTLYDSERNMTEIREVL
ncbi:AAA family ATPase [Burkholderia contaminans]|uniref:AAA family ATPase n=1 Tax=Burkholderia contaminans TaxID=488447 RepID=UPI0009E4EA33|nr:AAA family ATPase [Burkholderia contaminans]MEB4633715.1 AAA family ATPase [Burkholderia contaminans]MEB4638560.1 AAA family ATPase [Burkholderia contaminans]MEB4657626.1 AAA family ATPase [Burkholderia contaminans]MEB4665572.1 AAA family ATPase [Burkholderia contaminans]MEB4671716.1 AAA family ATPase [Burkholderia contaminans]